MLKVTTLDAMGAMERDPVAKELVVDRARRLLGDLEERVAASTDPEVRRTYEELLALLGTGFLGAFLGFRP